jgi:Fe-S oxidoreductase
VARNLKLHGVQKIITVDPHTTYALKELYPKYTGVSFDVQPYFALLRPREVSRGNGRPPVAIHDPCFYGRYLKVSEGPRQLLTDLGLPYADVRNCGEFICLANLLKAGLPVEDLASLLDRNW